MYFIIPDKLKNLTLPEVVFSLACINYYRLTHCNTSNQRPQMIIL